MWKTEWAEQPRGHRKWPQEEEPPDGQYSEEQLSFPHLGLCTSLVGNNLDKELLWEMAAPSSQGSGEQPVGKGDSFPEVIKGMCLVSAKAENK